VTASVRTVEGLVGHQRVVQRLWEAMAADRLHHAYLFEGPQGVGKRTLATLVALGANCEAAPAKRPCGLCPTCKSIAEGTHPDVIVLEPDKSKASATIPVAAVREVIRQAGYRRYAARRRVVIVDPAEAMQEAAANALLKTLEEPPEGTGFLLVTHNASALLPTIRSRCQRVRMGAVPVRDIERWLQRRGVEEAPALARLALGCPGRALALSGDGLEARAALRDELFAVLRGTVDDVFAFSQRLCSGNRAQWSKRVDRLLTLLEEVLRDVVVVGSGGRQELLNDDARDDLRGLARRLYPGGVTRCAEALQLCRDDLEVYVSGRLAVDALLCRVRQALGS
jgi:DNA polymerase-3 subunit delta'